VISPVRSSNAPRGVLLIGHGTRDPVGMDQFFELGSKLQHRLGDTPVEVAVLEFGPPTIPQAWQRLVERGVAHIQVAPLLLFAAGHAKQDIPRIIDECQARGTHVSCERSLPLSRHRSIVDLVVRRIASVQQELATAPSRTAVVMVGRGSHDPCAQADMRLLTEVAGRRFEAATMRTAFYAMAEPRLPEVLDRVAASGRFDGVAVYPHLLFEGRLYRAIIDQCNEAAQLHPKVRIVTSRLLGPDAMVADAIAERIGL
jgi:sirohydrochlorin cobaltochelatase